MDDAQEPSRGGQELSDEWKQAKLTELGYALIGVRHLKCRSGHVLVVTERDGHWTGEFQRRKCHHCHSVYNRVRARLTDEDICQRYLAGESQTSLAKADGRSHQVIGKLLRAKKIPLRDARVERIKGCLKGVARGKTEARVKAGRAAMKRLTREQRIENGRKSGIKCAESGMLERIRNLPQSRAAQVVNGRIQGRKCAESGKLAVARTLPQAKEGQRRAGRLAVASGQLRRAGLKGAQLGGRKAVESGQLRQAARISGYNCLVSGQLAKNAHAIISADSEGEHQFASEQEVAFYEVVKQLGAAPLYLGDGNTGSIALHDGSSYTPDWVLDKPVLGLPAKCLLEQKPSRKMFSGQSRNLCKAAEVGAVVFYFDELFEQMPKPKAVDVSPEDLATQ